MCSRRVGLCVADTAERLIGFFALAAHGQVGLVVDQLREAAPDDRMIVHDEDATFSRLR